MLAAAGRWLALVPALLAGGAALASAQAPQSLGSSYGLVTLTGIGPADDAYPQRANATGDAVGSDGYFGVWWPGALTAPPSSVIPARRLPLPDSAPFGPSLESSAADINSRRQIVGAFGQRGTGFSRALLWQPGPLESHTPHDLGTLGGQSARAFAINDSGVVVGVSETSTGAWAAFIWRPGIGMAPLENGEGCTPVDINARDRIVGVCSDVLLAGKPQDAVIWNEEGHLFWMGLGGATAMTDGPEWIVGQSPTVVSPSVPRAFFPYHDLTTIDGIAHGVNEARQVVGTYGASVWIDHRTASAFLYNGGILNDLNVLNASGRREWWFASATAIAEDGSILGWGPHPGVVDCSSPACLAPVQGFVITPVERWCSYQLVTPEPSPSRPDYIYVPPAAGSTMLDVLPDRVGCAWSVRKILRSAGDDSGWLSVPEVAAATGSRTVRPTFSTNTTGQWRFGQMEVAGRHVWIAQAGATMHVSDAAPVMEGGVASFTVTLSAPLSHATTVTWVVEPLSATAGDWLDEVGAVQLAAGQTSAQVQVGIVDDALLETEEVFRLRVAVSEGAAIATRAIGLGRIRASDPRVGRHGGIIAHPDLGARAQILVPPGRLDVETEVTLTLDAHASAALPADVRAATSALVVQFSPAPSGRLAAPGLTVTLPLLQPMAPGTVLLLYGFDQAVSAWRPILDLAGLPVRGTVESTGTTAVFAGVSSGATLIGVEPPAGPRTMRYLAEGASTPFFTTRLALLNPTDAPSRAVLSFLRQDGATVDREIVMPARTRATVDPAETLGSQRAEFSTTLSADVPLVLERTMSWDGAGYGSHAEVATSSPSTLWYLAEGATHSEFDLFYLFQNPGSAAVQVDVEYLRPPPGSPLRRQYTVPANSRITVWVDHEDPTLASTAVSARITATAPIVVERAMYLSNGEAFSAGHSSIGVTRQSDRWFFAEGATGPFFDMFLLLVNTEAVEAEVRARYLLPTGASVTRTYRIAPRSRFTVWVDQEDERLADTAVSTVIESTNAVPLVAERAMWWAGNGQAMWREAHNSAGAVDAGTQWALADGEVGGAAGHETYVLVANTSSIAGQVRATLMFEDGTSVARTFAVAANSRFNIDVSAEFPDVGARRFGAVVESLGDVPAQLVVERAMYSNAGGVTWAAGTSVVATRVR